MIDEYRYIWEAPKDKYVLVRLGTRLAIFNPEAQAVELIEDDEVYEEIVQRMISSGFAIVDQV